MSKFELEDVVRVDSTSHFVVFKMDGELYRIWMYDNSSKKVLQQIIDDGDDVIELGVFDR